MIGLILLVAALVLLLLAAFKVPASSPIDLTAAGLALAVLSMLIGKL